MQPNVRLRPLDIESDIADAVTWYGDADVLRYSEGEGTPPYDERTVRGMYAHLGDGGEVLVIEVEHDGSWLAVGDAVLRSDTLPIVIGDPRFRSRGVGAAVLAELIERARAAGWRELLVRKVFAYNERSLRLYRSAGFEEVARSVDDAGRETVQLRLALT